jgi:hypothetical protein
MSMTRDFPRLLTVLVLGLVARIVVIAPGFGTLVDPDLYLPIARSLAWGRGFCIWEGVPTANRPPLYPLLLVPIVRLLDGRALAVGVAALHITLGLGTSALVYGVARRWGAGPNRAAFASVIIALDPVVLIQVRPVMTETLAAFLVSACLASMTLAGLRGAFLSGLAFGLSALCRPSLLPGAVLVAIARGAIGPGNRRQRWVDATIFGAGVIATILPWSARNFFRFGEPIVTTTHGGHTLALANNPAYYADVVDGPAGAVWSGPNQAAWFDWVAHATAGMSPTQADRFLQAEGWRMLKERRTTFLRASLARLGRFWGIAPSGAVYPPVLRWATAAWTVPLWVALAWGLFRRSVWCWPHVGAPLVILGLTAVHSVYWTDMRMRVPIVPAIALIASGAARASGKNGGDARNSAGQDGENR